MKRNWRVALAVMLMSLGAVSVPAHAKDDEDRHGVVAIGQAASVKAGESVEGVVVVAGSATVRGEVVGDVIVIGGMADIDAKVGSLVAVGSARLGPKAVVDGDAIVVGGSFEADPLAKIRGEKIIVATQALKPFAGTLSGLRDWAVSGPLRARPLAPGVWWSWLLAAAFALLYILIAAGTPEAVEACAEVLRRRPVSALLAGILGLSGLAPFAFLLAVSVAGIMVVPLLWIAAFAATALGKTALCRAIGAKFGIASLVPATALGAAALLGLYFVPVLGLVAWALSAVFGFGSALLAGVEALRGESGAAPDEPQPEAVPAAASAAPAAAVEAASLPRADFWLRGAAIGLDLVVFVVLASIIPFVAVGLGGWALYQIGMWTWKGTTLGGMIVGIRGARLDGRPMDLSVAVVRHLASYLSALPMFLGFFWAAWDPERQSWHDRIAGTVVVRDPKPQALL